MKKAHHQSPIGVFDSGVGGLSILKQIHHLLPHEDLIYIADSKYAPYGSKTNDAVIQRCKIIVEYLISQGAKAIVIACNTATMAAISTLRKQYQLPLIGVEPGVKPAVLNSKSGVIAIMATSGTIASDHYIRRSTPYRKHIRFYDIACPGLADQIEKGELNSERTRALIENFLAPVIEYKMDALVLGCTHYPFVRPLIREIVGPSVDIIDTSIAIAKQLQRQLSQLHLLNENKTPANIQILSSADTQSIKMTIAKLWNDQVTLKVFND